MPSYLIAAGGTGGHIYPGIAIADSIKAHEPGSTVIFCGTEGGMENRLVPEAGYELIHIEAKGFSMRSPVKFVKAVRAFFNGRKKCAGILKSRKISMVIGTGGYVCGPVLSAANACRIKTLIHEQNSFPGKANRLFAHKADRVCISYPSSSVYFPRNAMIRVTGNPVRSVFIGMTKEKARGILRIDPKEKILFATGGSLGSRTINYAVAGMAEKYFTLGYRIILSSGAKDHDDLMRKKKLPDGIFEIRRYIPEQHLYMAAADLVLCRAGAITCSEIAVLGKASIMVPYPYAAGDHQTMNARIFSDAGASILIPDSELDAQVLYDKTSSLIYDDKILDAMGKAALTLAYPDASEEIYRCIQEITEKEG